MLNCYCSINQCQLTCEDGDSGPQLSVALIQSCVLQLQVLDLQRIVLIAEPAPGSLWFCRTVSEPGEDDLPLPPFPPMTPPLSGFKGAAAGEQQRPACRHHVVMAWGGRNTEEFKCLSAGGILHKWWVSPPYFCHCRLSLFFLSFICLIHSDVN